MCSIYDNFKTTLFQTVTENNRFFLELNNAEIFIFSYTFLETSVKICGGCMERKKILLDRLYHQEGGFGRGWFGQLWAELSPTPTHIFLYLE